MAHVVVADIGGTNSRFAHAVLEGQELSLRGVVHCPTQSLRCTEDALREARSTGLDPREADAVVWAVAGPVASLQARPTNAALELDLSELAGQMPHRPVILINDFVAQAWATLSLPGREAVLVLPGGTERQERGEGARGARETEPRGVLGAGTGLGTASLRCVVAGERVRWEALPAEGGHTAFALHGRQERDFGDFVCAALGIPYVCGDQLLSGRGLALLHHFLTGKNWPVQRVAAEALHSDSAVVSMFARFYGRMCRHWVLQTLCTGGLYLTGGVAVKNPQLVRHRAFAEEFTDAPPGMLPLLHTTPVYLMTREHAGLWGAARAAQELLQA